MGKKFKSKGINVYMQLIHFAVQWKLAQYCKDAILQWKLVKKQKAKKDLPQAGGQTQSMNKSLAHPGDITGSESVRKGTTPR